MGLSSGEFDDDELWNYVPMTRSQLGARRESDDANNPARNLDSRRSGRVMSLPARIADKSLHHLMLRPSHHLRHSMNEEVVRRIIREELTAFFTPLRPIPKRTRRVQFDPDRDYRAEAIEAERLWREAARNADRDRDEVERLYTDKNKKRSRYQYLKKLGYPV
jgi:hypothetical protein